MNYENKILSDGGIAIEPRSCQACKNSCYTTCSGSCDTVKCKGDCYGSCKTSVRK